LVKQLALNEKILGSSPSGRTKLSICPRFEPWWADRVKRGSVRN